MNSIFKQFLGYLSKPQVKSFPKAFSSLQRPTVMVRPLVFSKESVSLRIKPIKGKYMVQERNITLSEEGCLVFDFVNQMKDHEGAVSFVFFIDFH